MSQRASPSDRRWTLAGVVAAALLLQTGAAGCACTRYRFVSIEGPEDFRVVERSWSPSHYEWTVWPVPTRYEADRSGYQLEARTEAPYPHLAIRATDPEGNELVAWDPNQPFLHGGHATSQYPDEGSWSFDVLRDDEVVGSETIHFRVRSRPLACAWNLP